MIIANSLGTLVIFLVFAYVHFAIDTRKSTKKFVSCVFSDRFASWRAHRVILPEKLKATRNTSRVISPVNHKWFPTVTILTSNDFCVNWFGLVDNFNKRGSGFVLDGVIEFTLVITQFNPLSGSSYIPTPPSIAKKKAVSNIKNADQFCFQWAILSCLYPPKNNPCRVSNYHQYHTTLNFEDISFPVKVQDIPKFEKINPEISVNVISLDPENKGYCVEYLSPERYRNHHVNLLLLHDANTQHYVWIKNFSRLLGDRTNYNGASFVCNSCLNVFSSQRVLDSHIPNCFLHSPQQLVYPDPQNPEEFKLKFRDHDKEHPLNFYLVCDFESFLTPVDEDCDSDAKTHIIDEHCVSGFCCHRVTDLPQYQTPPTVYSGPDVMSKFYDHIISESETVSEILSHQIPLCPMSTDDFRRHRAATTCENCRKPFTYQNYKVRHHCHVTGQYLFPACNNCNLQLKPKRCQTAVDDKPAYFLPICIHNLKNYDSHFVIKFFQKRYTEKTTNKGHKVTYDDVKVIPLNGERFLQFQIANLKFIDSFQFLSASLEHLVELLLKAGKHNFQHTIKYLGDHDHVFAKGVFPYSYFTDRSKFDETCLPPIESFYNSLNDEPLSIDDYERAKRVWDINKMQTLKDYHDYYLTSDVLLLSDVFEHFRRDILQKHGLDCLYYPTLPSLAWSMALKHTQAELDLISDPEMYLMIENSIRGGISTISNRYSKSNNPLLEDFDPSEPTTYITYLDANNLYGSAQSEPLPVGDFKFLTSDEISNLDLVSIPEDSPTGYIIQCDLDYPPHLHDTHSDYPLAPEHRRKCSAPLRGICGARVGPP